MEVGTAGSSGAEAESDSLVSTPTGGSLSPVKLPVGNVCAFITDVDGTLLDHNYKVPPSTVAAINKLNALGVEVLIATARCQGDCLRSELGVHLSQVAKNGVFLNGQYVVAGGQVLARKQMSAASLREVLKFRDSYLGDPMESSLLTYGQAEDSYLIEFPSEQAMLMINEYTSGNPLLLNQHFLDALDNGIADKTLAPIVGSDAGFNSLGIYLVGIASRARLEVSSFAKAAKEYFSKINNQLAPEDRVEVVMSAAHTINICPTGMSKGSGAQILRKFLAKGDRKFLVGLGDSENDLSLIQVSDIGVAMGDGMSVLKECADFVTFPVDNDGWAHAVESVLLM